MRKILVVEDENILREAYEMILSTEPYVVDVAGNGKEALDKCQQTQYDLVLLDIMMPVMNGIEFLQEMKKLSIRMPKIIVMSNLSSGKEIEDVLSLGAHSTVLKSSLSPKQLLMKVRFEVETGEAVH